jgi:hypothetical protein
MDGLSPQKFFVFRLNSVLLGLDQDTDRYVFEVARPDIRARMAELKSKVQWTDLV